MDFVLGALFSTLIGLPFGIAASFIAWYIVYRWIVPSFRFSDQISKLPSLKNSGYRYRIKFKNIGWRAAADVEVMTRFRVRCLSGHPNFSKTWTMVTLHTDTIREPRIPRGASRSVVIDLEASLDLNVPLFTDAINGRNLNLETLLSLGEEADIALWIFAYDDFSGSRKVFTSKKYHLDDIALGKYGGKDGLEVILPAYHSADELHEANKP